MLQRGRWPRDESAEEVWREQALPVIELARPRRIRAVAILIPDALMSVLFCTSRNAVSAGFSRHAALTVEELSDNAIARSLPFDGEGCNMGTVFAQAAVTPSPIYVGWYCGAPYYANIATACAYPVGYSQSFNEGGGYVGPPNGSTIDCGPSQGNAYNVSPSPSPTEVEVSYIIRWMMTANYYGFGALCMNIVDTQNISGLGTYFENAVVSQPKLGPIPSAGRPGVMRAICDSTGTLKAYRLPNPAHQGVVEPKNWFEIFPVGSDVFHDLDLPSEHTKLLQTPAEAFKRLRIEVKSGSSSFVRSE